MFVCNRLIIKLKYFCRHFNNISSPHLRGKPKIVFIQACRGEELSLGVSTDASLSNDDEPPLGFCFMGMTLEDKPKTRTEFSDMVIFRATIPGRVSYRNILEGSWFVQSICEVLFNASSNYQQLKQNTCILFLRYSLNMLMKKTCLRCGILCLKRLVKKKTKATGKFVSPTTEDSPRNSTFILDIILD